MKFQTLSQLKEELVSFLKKRESVPEGELIFVVSPYRICPLGAHIDHQGGPVLGMTIEAYTILAFIPLAAPKVRLHSMNYPGVVEFDLQNIGPPDMSDWGRYVRGAAKVMGDSKVFSHVPCGFIGAVNGTLPSSGLSSSASVGLSYLYALTMVNELDLTRIDFIRLDRRLENDYLGLQNGILDQATIINGKKGHLLYINTITGNVKSYSKPSDSADLKIIIVHSGFTRELTSSSFNARVEECKVATKLLGEMGGIKPANILSDIPEDVFIRFRNALPEYLRRRADHYFSEVRCVEDGYKYWRRGDWVNFGRLMNESCKGSIENYESGSPALISLQEIITTTNGVYGSRFSGGGYGGCVICFAGHEFDEKQAYSILQDYLDRFPTARGRASTYFVDSDDGIRIL